MKVQSKNPRVSLVFAVLELALSCGALLLSAGCEMPSKPFQELQMNEVEWTVYQDPVLSYSLRYPTVLRPSPSPEGEVFFRYGWGVPVLVRFTDEAEGRKRGAWFGNAPVGKTSLAGHAGEKFIYEHSDFGSNARTVGYVIPYRGKFLALEFRAANELSEVQQQILSSFELPAE